MIWGSSGRLKEEVVTTRVGRIERGVHRALRAGEIDGLTALLMIVKARAGLL
jgi:hypothetical protein